MRDPNAQITNIFNRDGVARTDKVLGFRCRPNAPGIDKVKHVAFSEDGRFQNPPFEYMRDVMDKDSYLGLREYYGPPDKQRCA